MSAPANRRTDVTFLPSSQSYPPAMTLNWLLLLLSFVGFQLVAMVFVLALLRAASRADARMGLTAPGNESIS